MAVVILIRRVVKEDKINEFLDYYQSHRGSAHPEFIGEYLTRLDSNADLPAPMKNFEVGATDGVTFINLIFFKSAEGFTEHFNPSITFDDNYELENRQRIVMQVQDNVSQLTDEIMAL